MNSKLKYYYKIGKRKRQQKSLQFKKRYKLGWGTIQLYGLKLALKVYEKYRRKCKRCGSNNRLIIHHLDGKGTNLLKKNRKGINNNFKNLILLCQKCHTSIHMKKIWKKRKKEGFKFAPLSEEHKRKISKSLIGRKKSKFTKQHRKNLSKAIKKLWKLGKYKDRKWGTLKEE